MKCHRCLIGVENITKITSKSHDKPKVSQSRDPSIRLGPPGPGSIPQLCLPALSSWLVPQNEAVPSNLQLRPPCRLGFFTNATPLQPKEQNQIKIWLLLLPRHLTCSKQQRKKLCVRSTRFKT
jgi:hypothetical protein